MIPFDFSYARPDTVDEALALWKECHTKGRNPFYYSGGTEIITLCREMKIRPDLVIDIKSIDECNVFDQNSVAVYGAALNLNTVSERSASGLLAQCVATIADQTVRNRITLGGNIMGQLPFREALLPFLVLGGKAEVAGENGVRQIPLFPYNKRLRLDPGDLVTSFSLDSEKIAEPYYYIRKQKDSPVDYPILTACFSGLPGRIAMAVAGAFSSPLRDAKTEAILNQTELSITERSEMAVQGVSSLFRTDFRASAEYRRHLLKLAIQNGLKQIEG